MKAFKYLIFLLPLFLVSNAYSSNFFIKHNASEVISSGSSLDAACENLANLIYTTQKPFYWDGATCRNQSSSPVGYKHSVSCPSATSVDLKVPASSGSYVCTSGCQYKLKACVDVDFEAGMTCSAISTGQQCGTPKPVSPTNPPVAQDPTNPTDKTDEQKTFDNIMHVIGEKLDGIKDAITGANQNQDGGETGGSNGGDTGGDVNVNVDMSETNAKIDETNSLIDELTKWLQGEDLGDDIFGDSEPPEKELTPQQLDTDIFSSASQCPADAKLNFKLLGGKSFTKTFEFRDWCDKLEIFGSLILIFSYLFGAYIIVSKS